MKNNYVLAILCLFICINLFGQSDSIKNKLNLTVDKTAFNFIAMGDWGRQGTNHQVEVANQMGITGEQTDTKFYMILGDNFYESGVQSVTDKQWKTSFEDVYTAPALQRDWYVVLGNHDYKGNPQAEIDYHKIDKRWNMPARYYSKKFAINNDTTKQVLFVFLDTSPFIDSYYSSGEHDDVKTQDTAMQRKWLETILSDSSSNIKWRIVCGHHPLYTGGKRMKTKETKQLNNLLKPIFDHYKVDAYICGHEHNLQYIKPAGTTHYFVSGAGSELTPTIVFPNDGKFGVSENGFMVFSVLPNSLTAQIVDYKGSLLYKESILK